MADTDASTVAFVERMPRHPLVLNNHSMAWISDRIAGIVENKAPLWWWLRGFWDVLHVLSPVHRRRRLGQ
jgi:hypothetical protein